MADDLLMYGRWSPDTQEVTSHTSGSHLLNCKWCSRAMLTVDAHRIIRILSSLFYAPPVFHYSVVDIQLHCPWYSTRCSCHWTNCRREWRRIQVGLVLPQPNAKAVQGTACIWIELSLESSRAIRVEDYTPVRDNLVVCYMWSQRCGCSSSTIGHGLSPKIEWSDFVFRTTRVALCLRYSIPAML